MKFAHLADTHLGYRQYGLFEREKDFYEVFEKVIDKIIEENVDFVVTFISWLDQLRFDVWQEAFTEGGSFSSWSSFLGGDGAF